MRLGLWYYLSPHLLDVLSSLADHSASNLWMEKYKIINKIKIIITPWYGLSFN